MEGLRQVDQGAKAIGSNDGDTFGTNDTEENIGIAGNGGMSNGTEDGNQRYIVGHKDASGNKDTPRKKDDEATSENSIPQIHDDAPGSRNDHPPQLPPPAGNRIVLFSPMLNLTSRSDLGPPPCMDLNGEPTFFASAYIFGGVHPCKVGPHLGHACVPYARKEHWHQGRVDVLPYVPQLMELVKTSENQLPSGRTLVDGGHEADGKKLYHAVAVVAGVRVPGKAGEHLPGARVSFGGREYGVDDYEILCWRS